MTQETKLRFSAEDQVTPLMKKLRQESEQLGREMIRDARSYTTSGKEALRYIEDQIRAIERRSKADKESRIAELDIARQKGGISEPAYKQRASAISTESKIDQQQVTLLRELIETVKNTSRREIIEDRKDVERQLKSDRSVGELGVGGNELLALKKTLQRQEIGEVKAQETKEKEEFRYGKVMQGGIGAAETAAGSKNQFFAIAAGLAAIPLFGKALSGVAQRGLEAATMYQRGLAGMSQLSGEGQGGFVMGNASLRGFGETKASFLDRQRAVSIARGSASGSKQSAMDMMFLEKGTGLNREMFLELEKFTRAGGSGATRGTKGLIGGLRGVGAMEGTDISLLGEYLPILINLQREQLQITGEVKDGISTDLVAGIASMSDTFKNPDVLKNVLPQIMGGLRNPSTPQAQALQYSVLSGLNPNASLTDLQIAQEKPTLKYFQSTMSRLRGMGGGRDILVQNIKGMFPGLSTSMAADIESGAIDMSEFAGKEGKIDFKKLAGKGYGTTTLDEASASYTRGFETVGQGVIDAINGLAGKVGELQSQIIDDIKSRNETADQLEEAGNKVAANVLRIPQSPAFMM